MVDISGFDDIWKAAPHPMPDSSAPPHQTPEQYDAADGVLRKYPDEIQMLAGVMTALYYGAFMMNKQDPSLDIHEYYQGCILVLMREGVDADRIEQAGEMLQAVDHAIREAQ